MKEELFVANLPRCNWVGYEAVKAAGYRCKNNQIAAEVASNLMNKSEVKEVLDRLKEARLKKLGIQHELILQNRVWVAEADPSAFFNENGTVKPPSEWTPEMKGCVAGFEVVELFEGKGEDRKMIGYLKKIKLNDRNPAQHDLMDHTGLFSDRSPKIDLTVNVQNREMSDLELSARICYLVKCAVERAEAARQKQIERREGGEEQET